MSGDPYKSLGQAEARRAEWDGGRDARQARSRARRELSKLDWLRVALIWLFGLAVVELMSFGLGHWVGSPGVGGVSRGVLWIVYATLLLLIFLYGKAYRSLKQGDGMLFNWVLSLAILSTLLVVAEIQGFRLFSIFLVVDVFFFMELFGWSEVLPLSRLVLTVGLWYCARVAWRYEGIKRENPSAFEGRLEHGSATREMTRRDREAAGGRRRMIGIGAGILALVAVGGAITWKASGPSDPQPVIEEFELSWNRSDRGAVAALGRTGRTNWWNRQLKGLAKKQNWGEGLPPLSGGQMRSLSDESCLVMYQAGEGTLSVHFAWRGSRWCLSGIDPN